MNFVTGDTRSSEFVALLQRYEWSRMVIDKKIRPYPGERWCFDNGAWRDYKNGRTFDADAFVKRLRMAEDVGTPYMAVVPDVVCGGQGSLEFSNEWILRPELRNGWPWYLAVQNRMTVEIVEDAITKYPYHGIFIGGDDAFKRHTDRQWIELAHEYGLKAHYGRCGTKRKIRRALALKTDSCDSAFPLWIRDRLESVARSLAQTSMNQFWEGSA